MSGPIISGKSQEPNTLASSPGAYSKLPGDTPDVFEGLSRRSFPNGLSLPSHQSAELAKPLSETVAQEIKSSGRFLSKATEFCSDIVKSNNFYTSIGNTVMTSDFYSGLALHPLCAALAIFNERRERTKDSPVASKSISWLSQDINDTLRSPGIYRFVLGGVFSVNMVEAHASGNHLFGMIYGFASLGNLGAGRLLNQDYWKKIRDSRETCLNQEASSKNNGWTDRLTNPGINWCASDVLIGAMTLQVVTIASQISVGISTGFAVLGLGVAICLGKKADRSPIPLLLNGCCNLGFALTHATWGSGTDVIGGIPKVAIATGAWAIASFIIAGKQHLANTRT